MSAGERRLRGLEVALALSVAVLLLSEAWLYTPAQNGVISLEEQLQLSQADLYVNGSLRAPFSASVGQAFLGNDSQGDWLNVSFYYDGAFPVAESNYANWFGLSQHLAAVAQFRGVHLGLRMLDAEALAPFLTAPPARGSLLIMASGVLPDTVYGNGSNLPLSWMRAGGTLVWIGAPIGYFSGSPGGSVACAGSPNPGWTGTEQFLPSEIVAGPVPSGDACLGEPGGGFETPTWEGRPLGVDYASSLPNDDLNLTAVLGMGGLPVGGEENGSTNVAVLPEGAGRLVYFGGPMQDPTEISIGMMNLFESGLAGAGATFLGGELLSLAPGVTTSFAATVPLLPGGAASEGRTCVLTTQTDRLAEFDDLTCA